MEKFIPGLVSITFRKHSPSEVVSLVKEAGLQALEWGGDVHVPHGDVARAREVAQITKDAGLATAAYGSYYRVGQSEQDGLPFERVLESAVALEAPVIRVWPGTKGSVEAAPSYRKWVVEESLRIAELAGKAGKRVAFEYHAGTLTDTPESAEMLLREADHPALKTLWQPTNGKDQDYCERSLMRVLLRVEHLHVFHWWPDAGTRLPLADGEERWKKYFEIASTLPGPIFALMEFVSGDDSGAFKRDAGVLRQWLEAWA